MVDLIVSVLAVPPTAPPNVICCNVPPSNEYEIASVVAVKSMLNWRTCHPVVKAVIAKSTSEPWLKRRFVELVSLKLTPPKVTIASGVVKSRLSALKKKLPPILVLEVDVSKATEACPTAVKLELKPQVLRLSDTRRPMIGRMEPVGVTPVGTTPPSKPNAYRVAMLC